MKKGIFTLWASLAIPLSLLILNLDQSPHFPNNQKAEPITEEEIRQAMESTIQIRMFSIDSSKAEGNYQKQMSLKQQRGLGTLVRHNGEIILITNDHWGNLDALVMVRFYNSAGDQLLELDGEIFKDLVRYQDGGTLILGGPTGGYQSAYITALLRISQTKYGRKVAPAKLGEDEIVRVGETLIIVRQGRKGRNSVELIKVSVVSIQEQWGQPVYEMRSVNGENLMPGDSGGGLWLGGRLVGNMWKSESTYGWNWDSLTLEKKWTEISFAAGLPETDDEITISWGWVP